MRMITRRRPPIPDDNERAGTPRTPVVRRWVALAVLAAVLLSLLSADAPAYAQAESVREVLNNIQRWLTGILASLATVFLMIAGTRYVLAGGDPSEVEKAKTAFKAAGLGYLLAVLAPVVLAVLKTFAGLD